MKLRTILCFISAIALGVLRIFVIKTSVETESGFYVKGALLPTVFTVLVLASLVLYAVCALPYREKNHNENMSGGAITLVGSVIFALALLWCGIDALLSGNNISGALAVIGGISLIVGAPAHVMPDKAAHLPVCLLIPSIWCAYNLITVFRQFSTIITISDYLFEALSLTALLLFVFYAAKAYIYGKSSAMLHFSAYAVFAGVFVTALPSIYFTLSGEAAFSIEFTKDIAVLVSMLFYAPATVYTVDKNEI